MTSSPNAPSDSPWHAGELAIQQSIGVVQHMDRPGRLYVRNFLLEQHRAFYPLLHFVALGAVDAQGDAWATVRAGEPGFLQSPDAATLSVAADATRAIRPKPAWKTATRSACSASTS
jgi:predicted pyridoxine 5'-phosphate oxidase superfamily flavin-nucleotide-binding protein